MFLRKFIFVIILLPCMLVFSKEAARSILVQTNLKKFKLSYSKQKISITGVLLNLNLERKKCNSHILDRFEKQIKNAVQTLSLCHEFSKKNSKKDQKVVRKTSRKTSRKKEKLSERSRKVQDYLSNTVCKNFLTREAAKSSKKGKFSALFQKRLQSKGVQVLIRGKSYKVSYDSIAGNAFLSLPQEIQRMKIEEKLICSKNPQ